MDISLTTQIYKNGIPNPRVYRVNNIANTNNVSTDTKIEYYTTKYGFKTDLNGILEQAFNVAAGIPKDIKVHIGTLMQIDEYAKDGGFDLDPIQATKKAWSFFQDYISTTGNELYDKNSLAKMPKYIYQSEDLIFGKAVKITDEQPVTNYNTDIIVLSQGELYAGDFVFNPVYWAKGPETTDQKVADRIKSDIKEIIGMDLEPNTPKDKLSASELFLKFIHESTHNYEPKSTREKIRKFHEFIQSGESLQDFVGKDSINKIKQDLIKSAIEYGKNPDVIGQEIDKLIKELDKASKEFLKDLQTHKDTTIVPNPKIKLENYDKGMSLNIKI
ncbi:hypothetical protein CSPB12327_02750 [Campylobacter sp. RM12327]|uniref:hypothetical protein n=1 Tax=Campylobacter sputorum TaxID=206 RepID=UPI000B7748C6|nr:MULTISPECIES: hypothetical protein [Campylobacter]ASM40547.1 hypothetical protein CSPB_1356 [Campylobacter sputorum]MBE7357788.1 hypothetical protein [Campylobacter sp. RM11302]MBF6669066.1 hypothetical protein [Campylobacter sp. RM12327]MBF6673925.1 hypothetical protein [Campylobacter sp. RM13538]MBF6675806.1 hypothetical protein [Campylobacter sp. RM12321]